MKTKESSRKRNVKLYDKARAEKEVPEQAQSGITESKARKIWFKVMTSIAVS